MKNSIVKKKTIKSSSYVLGILFIFVIWHLGFLHYDNAGIIPSIEETLLSLKELLVSRYTYILLGNTLSRLVISMLFCTLAGVLLASISKISYHFKAFVKPLFTLLKTLPIAVVIVLLFVMLTDKALYYIVGVVILPIVYEATINGLDSIDRNIIEEIKMDSNVTPYVIGKVYLPLTLPYIFTSLLQSFGLGLKVLVMAEYITNKENSIGYEIVLRRDYDRMSYVYAWSIILVVFVIVIDSVINLIKKKSLA